MRSKYLVRPLFSRNFVVKTYKDCREPLFASRAIPVPEQWADVPDEQLLAVQDLLARRAKILEYVKATARRFIVHDKDAVDDAVERIGNQAEEFESIDAQIEDSLKCQKMEFGSASTLRGD